MRRLVRGVVAAWLVVLALVQVVGLALVWWIFIRTPHGQVLDASVLRAGSIGRSQVADLVDTLLDVVSLASLIGATIAIGFIAIARRRYRLAIVTTLLIVGATATSRVLKNIVIDRPDLGIAGTNIGAPNSLPSGHMTVAAAVTVAAVLVVPPRLCSLTAVIGTTYTALTGIATLSAGWHRPSDALAALLIVGIWASVGGHFLVLAQRHEPVQKPARPHHRTVAVLALVGGILLAATVLTIGLVDHAELTPPVELSTPRLIGAYLAGVTGIAGATCLLLAMVLSTVHRVVPTLDQPTLIDTIVEALPADPNGQPAAGTRPSGRPHTATATPPGSDQK
ncbi:phosphatase PAP2 family protein [Actinopolymorpha sp. B11F2]|uniref:phosphatase PAP2 family protein n=1 Tax=Actinopolymorpha sp. B11F2 TaxID=3160862 RepID=UPI0032E41760